MIPYDSGILLYGTEMEFQYIFFSLSNSLKETNQRLGRYHKILSILSELPLSGIVR